jgi:hypothetical protein|eukprot:2135886-Prymnesium_polylepis.1
MEKSAKFPSHALPRQGGVTAKATIALFSVLAAVCNGGGSSTRTGSRRPPRFRGWSCAVNSEGPLSKRRRPPRQSKKPVEISTCSYRVRTR